MTFLIAWFGISIITAAILCRCCHNAKQREKQFKGRFGSMEA